MTPDDVFVNISNPSVVAQEVATFMETSRDQVTPEFLQQVYQKMYTYGVPQPAVFVQAGTQGYPSYSG